MNGRPIWLWILGIAGSATLLIGFVSDAAERRGSRDVELGGRRYRCATLFQRFVAQLIDALLLVGTACLPGVFFGERVFRIADATQLAAFGAFVLAYFVALEASWGQTIGKRLVHIRVAGRDGYHPDWPSAFVRNIGRIADAFFLGYAVGVVAWWRSPEGQRIGDRMASTWVVSDAILVDDREGVRSGAAVAGPAAVQGFSGGKAG